MQTLVTACGVSAHASCEDHRLRGLRASCVQAAVKDATCQGNS